MVKNFESLRKPGLAGGPTARCVGDALRLARLAPSLMLELLTSQAAISLDHPRLCADFGRLNSELTQENSDRRNGKPRLMALSFRLIDGSEVPLA